MAVIRRLGVFAARITEADWQRMSYAQQKQYIAAHPSTKWRINKMSPAQSKQHAQIIQQTFRAYHKSRRGHEYNDFLGRPTRVDDAEHHRRSSFYNWRANIARALKTSGKLPARVLKDYQARMKIYEKHGSKAYEV